MKLACIHSEIDQIMWAYQDYTLRSLLIGLTFDTKLEEFIILTSLGRVLIVKSTEIFARHRVYDCFPDLFANLAVLIENRIICEPVVDAHETIEQASHVRNSACQSKTAAI